ncbi:MAG TPA: DUF302 domain-containing protein [Bacteroidales bacterium]|nr:DUF302 domain-containing protein [Bacteroidales bacterium]HPE55430.1 DUF302 domain-containing protein [Bacteroidales bacterium]HRX96077.1 DUF302 domain-containing protein [Bacteroidales bacterium]
MEYYISKIVNGDFKNVINKATELLKEEGFGVLTEINVKDTLKKKLDIDYKDYVILGACNPHLALRAFQSEDKIGTLLPCNVIVIDQGEGKIEIAIMNAKALMSQIGSAGLEVLAHEAGDRLERVLDKL